MGKVLLWASSWLYFHYLHKVAAFVAFIYYPSHCLGIFPLSCWLHVFCLHTQAVSWFGHLCDGLVHGFSKIPAMSQLPEQSVFIQRDWLWRGHLQAEVHARRVGKVSITVSPPMCNSDVQNSFHSAGLGSPKGKYSLYSPLKNVFMASSNHFLESLSFCSL